MKHTLRWLTPSHRGERCPELRQRQRIPHKGLEWGAKPGTPSRE